jgi:hypothetical protein
MATSKRGVRRNRKPNGSSVTSVPCKCKSLERAAEEPDVPIVFDEELNEYNLEYGSKKRRGSLRIYHCMFCGGAAPLSRRASLFASITTAERERLLAKTTGFKTLAEAIARLGKPDSDMPSGFTTTTRGSDTEPPKTRAFRVLRYGRLSKTTDVRITDLGPERGLWVDLQGKYLGRPKAPTLNAQRKR